VTLLAHFFAFKMTLLRISGDAIYIAFMIPLVKPPVAVNTGTVEKTTTNAPNKPTTRAKTNIGNGSRRSFSS
jgi:hypothetical protein